MFTTKQIGKDIIQLRMNPPFQACLSTIIKGYEWMGYVECDQNGNPLKKEIKASIKW